MILIVDLNIPDKYDLLYHKSYEHIYWIRSDKWSHIFFGRTNERYVNKIRKVQL